MGLHAGLAFSPISPYQLLERVDVDVIGVHVVNRNIALPEISLVYLIGVPSAGRGKKQHDDDDGTVRAVWHCGWGVCRRPDGFGL
jgi:hypothetical protein